MTERRVGLIFSDDPNTILSYGILAGQIMRNTSRSIIWKFISKQIQHMRPEFWDDYTRYPAGSNEEELNTEMIPELCKRFNPEFFLTIGDIQYFKMTRFYIDRTIPWIHYLPIDNHDQNSLGRNSWTINQVDIPICMSKFGRDLCLENGLDSCDKFIYPMVKSNHSSQEKRMVMKKLKGWQNVDLGFRKVMKNKEPEEYEVIKKYKDSLNIPEDATILLFVGRPGWRKNVQFLVSILRKLINERKRKVILYMHTDIQDPASTVNILKELYAHEIPNDAYFRTRGLKWWRGMHKSALNAVYNIADIQVNPHGGEGFGIPLAEGLSCEVPFVATDCTTTPELSGNGKWSLGAKVKNKYPDKGVIRPFVDLNDFCDKIEYLIDNPSERKRMGREGRKWVIKNLHSQKIAKQWLKVFELTNVNRMKVLTDKFGKAVLVDTK